MATEALRQKTSSSTNSLEYSYGTLGYLHFMPEHLNPEKPLSYYPGLYSWY
jgi:hypothetical protein